MVLPSLVRSTFAYNGDGQRVQKQDSTGITNHVWDGQNILLDLGPSTIVYTLEPALYGNLISQASDGTDSYYIFDATGSTRMLTTSTGSFTNQYFYDAFGNVLSGTQGTTSNAFQYIGRLGYYEDKDLATYYLRARIYDPITGRFISRDTVSILIVNFYYYVSNRPLTRVDPSGRLDLPRTNPDNNDQQITLKSCLTASEIAKPSTPVPWPTFVSRKEMDCCEGNVKKAWNSPAVQNCRRILGPADSSRCAGIQTPKCVPKCVGYTYAVYNEGPHSIEVCVGPVNYYSVTDLEQALCHELIHAWQSERCQPHPDPIYHGPDRCLNELALGVPGILVFWRV